MQTITFGGIEGRVLQSSPHGNYLVVSLSDRIAICGTFSNQWDWEESPDVSSGFVSFITYIGIRNTKEKNKYIQWVAANNGYFAYNEDSPRRSQRCKRFPLEIKVRGLSAESVFELIKEAK